MEENNSDALVPVTGSMFHTNYVKLERKVFCDDDCLQGGCPGHILQLEINNTVGVGCVKKRWQ